MAHECSAHNHTRFVALRCLKAFAPLPRQHSSRNILILKKKTNQVTTSAHQVSVALSIHTFTGTSREHTRRIGAWKHFHAKVSWALELIIYRAAGCCLMIYRSRPKQSTEMTPRLVHSKVLFAQHSLAHVQECNCDASAWGMSEA